MSKGTENVSNTNSDQAKNQIPVNVAPNTSAGGTTKKVDNDSTATDFETAIQTCGFGKFNIVLLLVAVPGVASTVFETSTMSYVIPSAECVLHLNMMSKGALNAVTYAGMIISALPWGYIGDTMGRKRVLTAGLLLDSVFVLAGACSQNVIQLMIFKFLGGFAACGPFAVLMSYISEMHSKNYRAGVMMSIGIMKTIALICLPVLAVLLLPQNINFNILGWQFYTWQIFVALTAIPSLLCGSIITFFPESPKFLMSQGKNAKAMESFKTIYAMNTGNAKESFPVKVLYDEAPEKSAKIAAATEIYKQTRKKHAVTNEELCDGLRQMKIMLKRPYIELAILVYLMNFFILMGQNSLRLWLPQIFVTTLEFERRHGASGMCEVLEYSVRQDELHAALFEECIVHIDAESYKNSIIVACSGLLGYFIASIVVSIVGNKCILSTCLAICTISGALLYWSTSELWTLIISSVFVTASSISGTAIVSTSVSIFPTVMRTMVVVLTMSFGRLGALVGNLLFPMFMSTGCGAPFFMVSSVMLCALLISLFLPNTNKKALK